MKSTWGDNQTQYFFELTPDRVLNSFEQASGMRSTGRLMPLNSMENRVYDIEIETEEECRNPSERFRILKFYRPGRWSKEQILEEHEFLQDLQSHEIPAVAPLPMRDGQTLTKLDDVDIWFAVFPKIGGRAPDELMGEQLLQVGRLLGRMHAVGRSKTSQHRLRLSCESYGYANLNYLIENRIIPVNFESEFKSLVEGICALVEPWFEKVGYQRIHGDCHLGNLIYGRSGFYWVDFDDMVSGPVVQDLWLMIPGRDRSSLEALAHLIKGYETMFEFDRSQLGLIEALRALRFVHFCAWIARRWHDPAFQRAFPEFGNGNYWQNLLIDLREQYILLQQPSPYRFLL